MPLEFSDGLGQISDWSGSGAADAALGDPIIPDGIGSTAAVGSPAPTVSIDLSGGGIPSTSGAGSPGVALLVASRLVTVYINDVNVTDLVEAEGGGKSGIQRNMQISTGGSKSTCQFTMNNIHGALSIPDRLATVAIYTEDEDGNVSKFFGGVVDRVSNFNYSGTADLTRMTINCADYGSLLDRVVVGREVQAQNGNDPTIITYQLSFRFFEPRVGVRYQFSGFPPRGGLGDVIFNWVSGTDAMNRIASDSGGNWRVDYDKVLYLFGNDGYKAAPFNLAQDDGKWRNLTVDQDMSRYRNRIYVKTTQNTRPLWTDTFTVEAGNTFLWITMAPMGGTPMIRKNGTVQRVVNFEEIGTRPYDFYWINTSVISNYASPPSPGDVLDVTYLSPLSYVSIAEDTDEIAELGLYEGVETVPDVPDVDALDAWAEAILERRKIKPTTIKFETDFYGLEAGQRIQVDVARSGVSDQFLITSVQTAEQAKKFFRHQITAVDVVSQIGDEAAFMKHLLAKTEEHRDRVMEEIHFQLAETINGQENTGLSVDDIQFAVRSSPATGLLHSCILDFNSHDTPPVGDSLIDVLQNGVSIFPDGDENKMLWPAGCTSVQTKLDFRADPMAVTVGDMFTINLIRADNLNHDGTLTIKVIPR